MASRRAFVALFVALALHACCSSTWRSAARRSLYYAIGLGAAALIAARGGGWPRDRGWASCSHRSPATLALG